MSSVSLQSSESATRSDEEKVMRGSNELVTVVQNEPDESTWAAEKRSEWGEGGIEKKGKMPLFTRTFFTISLSARVAL